MACQWQANNDIKKTWQGIKQLINLRGRTLYNIPQNVEVDGLVLNDKQTIVNAFNTYFTSIGPDLASKVPVRDNINFEKFMKTRLKDSFVLLPVTAHEIECEIQNLNASKSTGPYSIPCKLLKCLKLILSDPLAFLLNYSFTSGTVPDKLKMARVMPIYKKGDRKILSNYRPISILSIFNKIMERLTNNRLIDFFDKNNILFKGQFGFRANHSTDHAAHLITDKIKNAIENKLFACGIFLDLTKAFDTVDHNILIKKLEYYGIRGIVNDWFQSYLNGRAQFVSFDNISSPLQHISCGVPQGSVLGPLLFLLYINDFQTCAPYFEFHLYADDSNLFCNDKSLYDLETSINTQLHFVDDWLCANKLSLNVAKSNFVIFHPPQKKRNYQLNILIRGQYLPESKNVNYLGIIFDCNLSWKTHVHELTKKLARGIGVLSKLRHFVHVQALIQVYYSVIFPYLTYGLTIWGHTYESNLKPLVTLQKKAVRIITFSGFREHTSPLFKQLNLLKFTDIVYLKTAMFLHDYFNGKLPEIFDNFFSEISNIHQYNTRLASRSTYSLPQIRTNYGKYNIKYKGPQIWNDIDESIKTLSLFDFKRTFKNKLIFNY